MTIREKIIQDLGGSDDPARQKLLENSLKAAEGGKAFGHIGPLYTGGRDPLDEIIERTDRRMALMREMIAQEDREKAGRNTASRDDKVTGGKAEKTDGNSLYTNYAAKRDAKNGDS